MSGAIVVGGGAVGLCTAEALSARGVQTTLLERELCGTAATAGNAGWITPSLAIPVPGPGVIGQSLRWLLDPSGPLWIRPTVSPAMASWVYRFLRSCGRRRYRRSLEALQAAMPRAAVAFDGLLQRGARFEHHDEDLLYPAFTAAELAHLHEIAVELHDAGSPLEVRRVDGPAITALEPALGDHVVGGLVATGERRVRPESLARGVSERLRDAGCDVIERCAVSAITRDGGRWLVTGPTGEWRAETVVLAAGVATGRLLAPLGVKLGLVAAKGYSRTYASSPGAPSQPLYLETPKVAISVFDGAVRLSGTLELGATSLAVSRRRLAAITAAARDALPRWQVPQGSEDWAGMRSLSPDGLPYIGAVEGLHGLHVATGHATLGITLAPLTGELLASQIIDRLGDPLLVAFDPARSIPA